MSSIHSTFEKSRQIRPKFRIQYAEDENECPNVDIHQKRMTANSSAAEIARIQEKNIATLKDRFNQLRAANSSSKAAARMKVIELQKKIAATQNRQKSLKAQIADLENGINNQAKEEMAANVIDDIWKELKDYKGYSDNERHRRIEIPATVDIDESADISSIIPSIDECTVMMTPAIPSSPIITSETPSSMMMESNASYAETSESETPKKRRKRNTKVSESPAYEGSIASRRTRRGKDVYYKEPTLRELLSPASPFAFSLEEDRVAPSLPSGYVRSPVPKRRKKY